MQLYDAADLIIFDDALSLIRRKPSMYGGEAPRGPAFSAFLMRDLVPLPAAGHAIHRTEVLINAFAEA